ncbi:restriction endonuclease [Lactococcus lactis]|uniref:restriction endonuclease n=1 Tax=Lactococcus lactis TaxID=1358 RepID=UPI003D10DFA7
MNDELINITEMIKRDQNLIKRELVFTKEQSDEIDVLIQEIIDNQFENPTAQGSALEELTDKIFKTHSLYRTQKNLRTETNEIDLYIELDSFGTYVKSNVEESLETKFLVECKNYTNKVGVTFIGKFASLMRVSNSTTGIFVSKNGITGNSDRWTESKGLIKKIALRDNSFILDFKLSDFFHLEGKSLPELLSSKINALKLDVNINDLIINHELEEVFQ